ncbi:MAG: hypothetical protein ACK5DG_01575 [Chitinophagaceae bacterium]
MILFTATLLKFEEKDEKAGWTYIEISSKLAKQLNHSLRKVFVLKKSRMLLHSMRGLLPLGKGNFIVPSKTEMKKAIKKMQEQRYRYKWHYNLKVKNWTKSL